MRSRRSLKFLTALFALLVPLGVRADSPPWNQEAVPQGSSVIANTASDSIISTDFAAFMAGVESQFRSGSCSIAASAPTGIESEVQAAPIEIPPSQSEMSELSTGNCGERLCLRQTHLISLPHPPGEMSLLDWLSVWNRVQELSRQINAACESYQRGVRCRPGCHSEAERLGVDVSFGIGLQGQTSEHCMGARNVPLSVDSGCVLCCQIDAGLSLANEIQDAYESFRRSGCADPRCAVVGTEVQGSLRVDNPAGCGLLKCRTKISVELIFKCVAASGVNPNTWYLQIRSDCCAKCSKDTPAVEPVATPSGAPTVSTS